MGTDVQVVLREDSDRLLALSPTLKRTIASQSPARFEGSDPSDPGNAMVIAPAPLRPSPDEIAEATRKLAHYEAAACHVDRMRIENWLKGLNAAVANPQGKEAFKVKLDALHLHLADYPSVLFNEESLKAAARSFEFFPSAAKLTGLLDIYHSRFKSARLALRRVADWVPPQPEPEAPLATDEDKAKVAAALAELRAWQEEQRDMMRRRRSVPVPSTRQTATS